MDLGTLVGPATLQDGAKAVARGEKSGALVVQELHGRFYEQTYRGAVFSGGMTLTSISNATFASLTSSTTPVIGVWNPSTSGVNLVLIQAQLQVIITALQNTGPGGFVWASSVGNTAITTGNAPFNRKTGAAAGSAAKDLSGVALTGLTNNLVIRHASGIAGGNSMNLSDLMTAVGWSTVMGAQVENFDGNLIVPPGGVYALLAVGTAVAHSAASALIWEEIPV